MSSDALPKFKVVFVGDSGVGKTTIIQSLLSQYDPPPSTTGAICTAIQSCVCGREILLNIWDTAGQDSFRHLVPIYARGAHAAVIVFDQTQPITLEHVDDWYNYLLANVGDIFVVLVGNKIDRPAAVNWDAAGKRSDERKIRIIKTAGINGTHVERLIEFVSRELAGIPNDGTAEAGLVQIESTSSESKNAERGCCG
jgi:Ras-related protein Rab-6A